MQYPTELEVLEALPVVSSYVDDGNTFWYEFRDEEQTLLYVSFNPDYGSVQTDVVVAGRRVVSVCQEGAVWLRVRTGKDGNGILLGEFGVSVPAAQRSAQARLEVHFHPAISVTWSTLWDAYR